MLKQQQNKNLRHLLSHWEDMLKMKIALKGQLTFQDSQVLAVTVFSFFCMQGSKLAPSSQK